MSQSLRSCIANRVLVTLGHRHTFCKKIGTLPSQFTETSKVQKHTAYCLLAAVSRTPREAILSLCNSKNSSMYFLLSATVSHVESGLRQLTFQGRELGIWSLR